MRSIAAVLAGFITLSVLLYAMQAVGTAALPRTTPNLPDTATVVNYSDTTRVLWLIWETASMVAAGYVTARIAGSSHVAHATLMGAIQAIVTVGAMLSNRGDAPLWFWIIGIVLMVPAAWFGGTRRVRRM